MNYYRISHDVGGKKTIYDIHELEPGYDWDGTKSIRKINLRGKIENETLFPTYILDYNKKLHDLISTPFHHSHIWIISSKFLDVLTNLSIEEYQVFPINLLHRGKVIPDYFIFYVPIISYEAVDFDKSEFCMANYSFCKIPVKLQDKEEYFERIKELKEKGSELELRAKSLAIREDNKFEMLRFLDFFSGIVISDSAYLKIQNLKLSGIRFEPLKSISDLH
jgi:hypothetical protein